jgi:hypothetical protein|tara:strand:+ start:26 stop:247 length:222 start_codon:yes stop_codon:yes gene_type:complete
MAKKVEKKKTTKKNICGGMECGSGGVVYGLGFIGALVYYISNATSFWMGVLGILKAIVWPAFLVYELMKFLGM